MVFETLIEEGDMTEVKEKKEAIIREDDYADVNCHELESFGEIEIHWDLLPNKWSVRHAEWEPRCRRKDPEFDRGWSESIEIIEGEEISMWNPYELIFKKFSLNGCKLSSEEILKLNPKNLNALAEGSLNFVGVCKCGSNKYCLHLVGSSGCDSVDDFRLICPTCGELDQFVHVDMGNDQETCPWCDKKA